MARKYQNNSAGSTKGRDKEISRRKKEVLICTRKKKKTSEKTLPFQPTNRGGKNKNQKDHCPLGTAERDGWLRDIKKKVGKMNSEDEGRQVDLNSRPLRDRKRVMRARRNSGGEGGDKRGAGE